VKAFARSVIIFIGVALAACGQGDPVRKEILAHRDRKGQQVQQDLRVKQDLRAQPG
jgi:hypothetical protein